MSKSDSLYPECPKCGKREGIYKAKVAPANCENNHDVTVYELACGHTLTDPDVVMEHGVVELIQRTEPEYIEVEHD